MKKILIALFATLLSATACHQSDGYIGDFFGIWMMDDLTVNGQPADIDLSIYSWRFQSSVVMITTQLDPHNYRQCTGSWADKDNWLVMDFTHKFENVTPPQELFLSADAVERLEIQQLSSSRMVLSKTMVSSAGQEQVVVYYLRKLN